MCPQIIILDDDPTGIQTVHGCLVLTKWDADTLKRAFEDVCPFFYVLTNTRAYSGEIARSIITEVVRGILDVNQTVGRRLMFVSRSDSTLRSHFPLEIEIIADLFEKTSQKPIDGIFLVPAFFEGGRITRHDTHLMWDGQAYIPTADTEFARDAVFGYSSSHLPSYIAEKTHGQISAQEVLSVSLDELRDPDTARLHTILDQITRRRYIVVNTETYADLDRFTDVIRVMTAEGKTFVFQSAASLVKSLTQNPDKPLLGREIRSKEGPGLVVVGSHVAKTSLQLQRVLASAAVQPIEIDVNALLASERRQLDSVYALIAAALQNQKTPVVYTSRQELRFSTPGQRLQAGQTIASFLATLVQRLPFYPAYIIAKGGITSHEILVRGLQVATARVLGQILPGVPVIALPAQHRFGAIPYVIFPGNVGEPDALQNALNRLM